MASGAAGQLAGAKPRGKGRLGRPSDPAGPSASEDRAGLERVDADAGKQSTHAPVRSALLHAIVHPADIQDRDGGILLLATLFADGGYRGPVFQNALAKALPHLESEIVKRPDHAKGFKVLTALGCRTQLRLRRVRHSINLCLMEPLAHFAQPRPAINLTRNALAFLRLASIRLMLRKLCNPI
jgi:hypothetical protein